jgi:PKD repeat protein
MNTKNQIKTHFDFKIIIFFISIFVFSCLLLAFQKANEVTCEVTDFKIEAAEFTVGELVTFSENSSSSFSWRWYFGDGTDISYKSKIGHVFTKPGKYKVKLLINESCEIEKMVQVFPKVVIIKEKLEVDFDSPTRVTQGESVQFQDKTNNGDTWEWRFGESGKVDSKSKNPKYTFRTIGVKTVSLVVNGDKKNIKFSDIVVVSKTPTKVEKKRKKTVEVRPDTLVRALPEAETTKLVPSVIKTVSESEFTELMYSISEDKITLSNFKNHFCYDFPPLIKVNSDKRFMTLDQLYKSIRNKGIKIRKVTINKEKDKCIESIHISFKFKTFF